MPRKPKGTTTVTKPFSDHNARCMFEAFARIVSEEFGVNVTVESVVKRSEAGKESA